MNRCFRFISLLLVLFLAGCGFQLRGAPHLAFHSIYLSGPPDLGLARQIRQALTQEEGLTIATAPEKADVVLYISPLVKQQQILTLNAQGSVSQYTLLARMNFRATDGMGNELLAPTHVSLSRVFNYNDVQILAKQIEQDVIYKDMERQLVQEMIFRLATLNPATAGNNSSH